MVGNTEFTNQKASIFSEVHRRPIQTCGAPSISYYRAWWVEVDQDGGRGMERRIDAGNELMQKIKNSFESEKQLLLKNFLHLSSTYTGIFGNSVNHDLIEEMHLGEKSILRPRKPVFRHSTTWRGAGLKISIDLHEDFLSECITVDCSKVFEERSDCLLPSFDEDGHKPPAQQFQELLESIFDSCFGIEAQNEKWQNVQQKSHSVFEDLFDLLMEDIASAEEKLELGCKWVPSEEEYVIRQFADFRGLTLPHKLPGSVPPTERKTKPSESDELYFDAREERNTVSTYWPLIRTLDEKVQEKEIVACSVLDHGAIYTSMLGGHYKPKDRAMVRFLVVPKFNNRWQIGRLVNRINMLGVFRIQAIRDLEYLRVVSGEVRILGRFVDELQKRTSDKHINKDAFHHVSRFYSQDDVINGYIEYRISKSRYYVGRFIENVSHLRLGRIEGLQPYDEFVRRRLFPTFDFIDKLGNRISSLRDRVSLLVRTVQMIDTRNNLERQTSLAEVGEVVELFAVSYYGGQIAYSISKGFGGTYFEKYTWYIVVFLAWLVMQRVFKITVLGIRGRSEKIVDGIVGRAKRLVFAIVKVFKGVLSYVRDQR